MEESKIIHVTPYNWEIKESDENYEILCWSLDRKSNVHLIRIPDYPCRCYFELPERDENGTTINWTSSSLEDLNEIFESLKSEIKPIKSTVVRKKKLYYYNFEKTTPMIEVQFMNPKSMLGFRRKFSRATDFQNKKVKFPVWEADVDIHIKLTTEIKGQMTGWYGIPDVGVPDDDKISRVDFEHKISYKSMVPMDVKDTVSWIVNPGILSFDFEAYSDNPKSMPVKQYANHIITMISVVYQRFRLPNTRQKFGIIVCTPDLEKYIRETDVKTYIVSSEVELLDVFMNLIAELDPEIITGYNISGFDYDYLSGRLAIHQKDWPMNVSRLLGVKPYLKNTVWESDGAGVNDLTYAVIPGRITIDAMIYVRRTYGNLSKYSLEFVGQHFLSRGKHDVTPQQMFEIYERCESQRLFKELQNLDLDSMNYTTHTTLLRDMRLKIFGLKLISKKRLPNDKIVDVLKEIKENNPYNEREYIRSLEDTYKVYSYCIEDSNLVTDLFDNRNIWTDLQSMASVAGINVTDVLDRGQQIRTYSRIYNECHVEGSNYVLSKRDNIPTPYSGAHVYPPLPGCYENIICLDFSSLYPSIIIAMNICYTTFVPPHLYDLVPLEETNVFEWEDEVEVKSETEKEINPTTGRERKKVIKKKVKHYYRFKKSPKGLMPKLLEGFLSGRKAVKNQMNGIDEDSELGIMLDFMQKSRKMAANSGYGSMGVENGKLPLVEGASCVTFTGRKYINKVDKYVVEKYNGVVVYGDTDSAMIDFEITDPRKCESFGKQIAAEITEWLPKPMKLEYEKSMRLLCITKKRYAALWINADGNFKYQKNGEIYIYTKGIVLARRDNCKWLRNTYEKCLKNILLKKPMIDTLRIIIDAIDDIVNKKVSIEDLSVIKSIGASYKSETAQMKVFADELVRNGHRVNPGDRLEYVVILTEEEKTNPRAKIGLPYKMRLIEMFDSEKEMIDIEYYIEHMFATAIDQLFSVGYIKELKEYEGYGFKPPRSKKYIHLNTPSLLALMLLKNGFELNKIFGFLDSKKEEQKYSTVVVKTAVLS